MRHDLVDPQIETAFKIFTTLFFIQLFILISAFIVWVYNLIKRKL